MMRDEPPTFDERPPLDTPPADVTPGEPTDWRANLGRAPLASDATVKTRKRVSAIAASINAAMKAAGVDDACRNLNLDANEFRRMCLVMLDAAQRAEYEAERRKAQPPQARRFKATAYVMELFYKRRQMPKDLTDEERARLIAALARNWRRRFKRFLTVQRFLHLGLFDYEPGVASSNKKVAPHLIDRLSDLLADVQCRAAEGGGEPIGLYNRAAEAAVAHFRATVPEFAPEWEPEPKVEEAGAKESAPPKGRDPRKVVAATARATVKKLRAFIADERLTETQAEELRAQLHAQIEAAWADEAGPGGVSPPEGGRPCDSNADNAPPSAPPGNLDRTQVSYLAESESSKTPAKARLNAVQNVEIPKAPAEQARAFVDVFESVGATKFKAVYLSCEPLDGDPTYCGSEDCSPARLRARCLSMVERSERRSESVSVRAYCGSLIQLDDVTPEQLPALLPFSYFAVETSPKSFQAWIALPADLPRDAFKAVRERLLRRHNPTRKTEGTANGGAYGAIRMPGTLNAKEKHRRCFGELPRVSIVHLAPGLIVPPLELEHAGLLAEPLPAPAAPAPSSFSTSRLPEAWPDINVYRQRYWKADAGRADRSRADEAWVCAAARLGFSRSAIAAELPRVSDKARARPDYVERTANSAFEWLAAQPDARADRRRERMVI